jgi:hypothetical protein
VKTFLNIILFFFIFGPQTHLESQNRSKLLITQLYGTWTIDPVRRDRTIYCFSKDRIIKLIKLPKWPKYVQLDYSYEIIHIDSFNKIVTFKIASIRSWSKDGQIIRIQLSADNKSFSTLPESEYDSITKYYFSSKSTKPDIPDNLIELHR